MDQSRTLYSDFVTKASCARNSRVRCGIIRIQRIWKHTVIFEGQMCAISAPNQHLSFVISSFDSSNNGRCFERWRGHLGKLRGYMGWGGLHIWREGIVFRLFVRPVSGLSWVHARQMRWSCVCLFPFEHQKSHDMKVKNDSEWKEGWSPSATAVARFWKAWETRGRTYKC